MRMVYRYYDEEGEYIHVKSKTDIKNTLNKYENHEKFNEKDIYPNGEFRERNNKIYTYKKITFWNDIKNIDEKYIIKRRVIHNIELYKRYCRCQYCTSSIFSICRSKRRIDL